MTGGADTAGAREKALPAGISPAELRRQLVHAGFGLIALSLRWLSWPVAAAIAALAVVNNLLLLPRLPGGSALFRPGEARLGGIVLYPLVVLGLILALPLHLAAATWMILAVGDGASNVCGRTLGVRRLPWNRSKSWAGSFGFLLLALPSALFALWFVGGTGELVLPFSRMLMLAAVGSLVGALVESLPLRVDDNLSVGAGVAAVLFLIARVL